MERSSMRAQIVEEILDRLESVAGLHPKAGVTYALHHFSEVARIGIGLSEGEVIRAMGQSSPFVHTWDDFHRYTGICKEFVAFCKNEGANKLHKVRYETVEQYLLHAIRRGDPLDATIPVLQKFFHACARQDLRDEIGKNATRLRDLARKGAFREDRGAQDLFP
jgi:hypothetical protein